MTTETHVLIHAEIGTIGLVNLAIVWMQHTYPETTSFAQT